MKKNHKNYKKLFIKEGVFFNKWLIASVLVGIGIQWIIITIPFTANIFKVYQLSFMDWLIVLGISLIPFFFNEIIKLFSKKG